MEHAVLPVGQRHRVLFEKTTDRWRHSLQVLSSDQWHSLWVSQEGTSDDDWPASPPIQEIHEHQLPTGPCWLAVGRAGSAHWSLSVDLIAHDSVNGATRVRFDVACRSNGDPGLLGSSYQQAAANPTGDCWLIDESLTTLNVDLQGCRFAPLGTTESRETSGPRTTRWVYFWQAS